MASLKQLLDKYVTETAIVKQIAQNRIKLNRLRLISNFWRIL